MAIVPTIPGVVVFAATRFFMPPRILVAPAAGTTGARLPRGVHALVAVPVVAAASPSAGLTFTVGDDNKLQVGLGDAMIYGGSLESHAVVAPGAGAMRRWTVAAAAAADAGFTAGDDDGDDAKKKKLQGFYGDLEAHGLQAVEMLSSIEPPARLAGKAKRIKEALDEALEMVKVKEEKMECVKTLLYAIYGIIDLAGDCTPIKGGSDTGFDMSEWFSVMALAAKVDDTDAMVESVTRAMRMAMSSLRRCIGHTAAGASKLLRFEDPEDW